MQRAQLQAVDDIARPLVDKYLDGVLEQAGIRPSGGRPSPGQIAYILDLARERKMSRKALAALVREVSGAEFEIPPRTGADEVAALIAGAVNRLQASRLIERASQAGCDPLGVEGEEAGEWVLVDLQDVVVHVVLGKVREFYKLENLWVLNAPAARSAV